MVCRTWVSYLDISGFKCFPSLSIPGKIGFRQRVQCAFFLGIFRGFFSIGDFYKRFASQIGRFCSLNPLA